MFRKNYFSTFILLFFFTFYQSLLYSQSDTTGDAISKGKTVKQEMNIVYQAIKELQKEITLLNKDINQLKKDYNLVIKNINKIDKELIETIDKNKVSELKNLKDQELLKKVEIEQKLIELTLLQRDKKAEIKKKKEEKDFVYADGTLNWSKTFDIKNDPKYKSGKWHIAVRAKDNQNNYSEIKKINIKIDPKSDIPTLSIINPTPMQRVTSTLRVVGTASDDDGIGKVVMLINGSNEEVECIGTDFWYYDINTSVLEEGPHKITLKAYDIKGVPSKTYSVVFNVDKASPFITVKSKPEEATLAGKIKIEGNVVDGNGIATVEYSVDNRKSFKSVENLRYSGKNNNVVIWGINIDSEKLMDGMQTIWLRSIDKTGSVSYESFTYLIDHKRPVIEIQYPKENDKVNGKLTIFGYAYDNVGIKKATIDIKGTGVSNKLQQIMLRPGNTLWSHDFDLTEIKNGKYQLIATIEDVAGNIVTSIVNVNVDQDTDKANVDFSGFNIGDKFSSMLPVYGKVYDDDGTKEVSIKIVKKDRTVYEDKIAIDFFGFCKNIDLTNFSQFEEGEYTLELTPYDINDKTGNIFKTKFFIDRSYPKFDIDLINKWAGKSFNKISLPQFNVIKYGDLKSVSFSILNPNTNNSEIIQPRELKFKKGKTEGLYEIDPILLDSQKDKIDISGFILIKLIATDSANNSTTLLVPIIYDNINPTVSLPAIDQTTGMIKDEELLITDNLLLEKVKLSIISTDKTFTPIQEELTENIKEYQLNVKTADNKFVEYTLTIEVSDKAGNIIKNSQKINFKQTTEQFHKLIVKITKNKNTIYSMSPIVFVEDKNFGLEKYNATYYAFLPEIYTEGTIEGNKIKKSFLKVDEANGLYIMQVSQDEMIAMDKGSVEVKNIFKSDKKSDAFAMTLFNDTSNPTAELLWPTFYMSFNKNFTTYFKISDDSGEVIAEYITDDVIPRNFTTTEFESNILNKIKDPEQKRVFLTFFNKTAQGYTIKEKIKAEELLKIISFLEIIGYQVDYKNLKPEAIDQINNINASNLNPLKQTEAIALKDFIKQKNISLSNKEKLVRISSDLTNVQDGEHFIKLKIKDKAGRESNIWYAFYVDKKEPNIKLWELNPTSKIDIPSGKTKEIKQEKIVAKKYTKKEDINKKNTEELNESTSTLKTDLEVKEKINGLITLRGDAQDDTYLHSIIVMFNGKEVIANGKNFWESLYDLTKISDAKKDKNNEINHTIEIYGIDLAGNKNLIKKDIIIAEEEDIPVVFINKPAIDNQRFGVDVDIAGIAFDDDGIDYVEYQLSKKDGFDKPEWVKIPVDKISGKWATKIPSGELVSRIYYLEVRAIDLYGKKSEIKKMQFHVDKENPVVTIQSPSNGSYLRGNITINGIAEDPNEIASVEISTNYGWSYVFCEGTENWKYNFDTKTVPDGVMRVLIKTKDKAGSEGFSFALYNIDNKDPEVDILLPKDGMKINNIYKIVGRAKDNLAIKDVKIKIASGSTNMLKDIDENGFVSVTGKEAWSYQIDTRTWDTTKTYNLITKITDMSGNVEEKSILFTVDPKSDLPVVDLIQPQPSQHMTGEVLIFFGNAYDDDTLEAVYVRIDDGEIKLAKGTNRWQFSLPTIGLATGKHKIEVFAKEKNSEGKEILSEKIVRYFYFDERGPIVDVKSHINGSPIGHRPWLVGNVKYYIKDLELKLKKEIQEEKYEKLKKKYRRNPELLPAADTIPVKVNEVNSFKRKVLKENQVDTVILTYNNGKNYFKNYRKLPNWKIRLQTQFMGDGEHMLQIKAITKNGESNLEYFKVIIDRNIPTVIIDKPIENMPLNETIAIRGSTNDNGTIEEVQVALKRFDKDLGKIPQFVQGIYLWAQAFGGPWVSGGFGLSFFDDIVRLEGMFGWTPTYENIRDFGTDPEKVPEGILRTSTTSTQYSPRFSGFSVGGKLLARVIDIPFEFFWGEDARNFSISVEIGAGFYWFSGFAAAANELNNSYYNLKRPDLEDGYQASKDGKVVAGFMYQIDFFKVERYGLFRKFALYFENAFFFVASEIEGGLIPQFGFGIRNALF